ncbi:MAG: U32 family peptidase [Bacteroidales bacterium]
MQLRELELLAPAKNRDIGTAAINCGADALYIAGPSFGAREAAGNPISEIETLAAYAHRFGAKVYMTLNTILFQSELEEAVRLSKQAYEAGCDALIIQDLGLLKAGLPPIPLFASTQTNIRSVKQAMFLESLGFKRLILARELSLAQIEEIRACTSIELESFIHGALCVSYSGQCYLSAKATGRSANRGVCVQACRSQYNLVDNSGNLLIRDKALLSLKDLNMGEHIEELAKAGISSFKIEGRLKNISYIKNVVKYYRSLIDRFISSEEGFTASSAGQLYGGFTPRPEMTFNRGYTDLFISGKRGKWQSGEIARSVGEYIGKVEQIVEDKSGNLTFRYESDNKIHNGDGLCFITPKGKVLGARASSIKDNLVSTNEPLIIAVDSKIYRNFNHNFEKELEQNMPKRLIEVELQFISDKESAVVKAQSQDGCSAEYVIEGNYELAKNEDLARQNIINQLSKTSDIYKFTVSEIEAQEILFFPASSLNEVRRSLADKLSISRERKRVELKLEKEKIVNGVKTSTDRNNKIVNGLSYDYRANISNNLARELYKDLGADSVEDAFELSPPLEAELMRSKYCIKFEMGICPKEGAVKQMNEPLFLENNGKRYRLGFDCKNCEMVIFG